MMTAADLDDFYADGDVIVRAAAAPFRGFLAVADSEAFDAVKVGDYQLRHPAAVGLAQHELITVERTGEQLRVYDVSRIEDGLECVAVLVKLG